MSFNPGAVLGHHNGYFLTDFPLYLYAFNRKLHLSAKLLSNLWQNCSHFSAKLHPSSPQNCIAPLKNCHYLCKTSHLSAKRCLQYYSDLYQTAIISEKLPQSLENCIHPSAKLQSSLCNKAVIPLQNYHHLWTSACVSPQNGHHL